jgi:RimJ/RimL family protein N-acetyltransferase
MPDPLRFVVPTRFETARLLLRPFELDDAPALHEALVESLPALRAQLWSLPWIAEEQTLESAEVRCRRAQANFLLRTDLAWLAFERSSGRLVGSIGLHRTDWELPKTEVGYWVRSSATGRGYACEGVMALTHWALHELGATRVELVTDELNAGSRAVALRCGFVLEGILHNTRRAPDGSLWHSCLYARLPVTASPP